MIAVLAKLGSPEIAGQYALGVAVSAPILVLAQSRPRDASATDIRVTSLALALLGIAAVGFLEHGMQDRMALVLVVLAESVEWIAEIYAGQRSAVSLGLHSVLPIAALGVVFARTGHLGAGVLAVLIVRLLALFCYDFKRVRRQACPDDRERRIARLAANVPCYFIAHMLGYGSLGIFAAMASLAPVGDALVHVLGQAVSPKLKRLYDDGDRQGFREMSVQLGGTGVMLGLCSVAGALVGGPWVLGQLFGAEYAGQPALLLALSAVAGGTFVATLLGCTLTAGRRGDDRMPLEIAAVAATSLACVALVPRAGLLGAAGAAGFGCLVRITGQLWLLRSILLRPRQPALLALLKAPLAQ
jgi:hypothetical protein